MSSGPTLKTLSTIATDLGIKMTDARLAAAAVAHAAFRPKLDELRRFNLDFLSPLEPGHAYQWIVSGGVQQTDRGGADTH